MVSLSKPLAAIAGLAVAFATPSARAAGIDWAQVAGKQVVLFYPGQSSWEWALTPTDMSGAAAFRSGTDCKICHAGQEKVMGAHLASGQKNEPTPIAGKPGSIMATVKFARDARNMYVHFDIDTFNQPDAGQGPAAMTVTMLLGETKVPEFTRGGCFSVCHEDSTGMPAAGGARRTMYLSGTRARPTRQGGGDALKPAAQLAKMQADGYILEYWQARLDPGSPAQASDGTVFDTMAEVSPPIVMAEGTNSGNSWSVTLSRKLNASAPFKSLGTGETYTVGFAVHAGHTTGRFHYVSLESSLALDGGNADFIAVKK